ncbi:MAG: nitroreductase family protein [Firmicutes bacterium]|nr:nitroreductase family protein [Bacillota bacterium]
MKKNIKTVGVIAVCTLGLFGCAAAETPAPQSAAVNAEAAAKADSGNTDAAVLLTEVKTTQYFTDEEVPKEDIEKILAAGINAPSAMNTQPWHFTAVTDKETTQKLADAMGSMKPPAFKNGEMPAPPEQKPDEKPSDAPKDMPTDAGKADFSKAANKAGIGSAPLTVVISCEEGSELSAGLAVQNMSAEAQILGYGTKIMTSPTMALNGENQAEYKELLSIPENQSAAAVLLVGKAASPEDNPDALSSATTRNDFDDTVTVIE